MKNTGILRERVLRALHESTGALLEQLQNEIHALKAACKAESKSAEIARQKAAQALDACYYERLDRLQEQIRELEAQKRRLPPNAPERIEMTNTLTALTLERGKVKAERRCRMDVINVECWERQEEARHKLDTTAPSIRKQLNELRSLIADRSKRYYMAGEDELLIAFRELTGVDYYAAFPETDNDENNLDTDGRN